jgi:SpoVK/Ycf46/Vps4 family AAA+-type ATPase
MTTNTTTHFIKSFKNISKYNNFLMTLDKKSYVLKEPDFNKLILNPNISGTDAEFILTSKIKINDVNNFESGIDDTDLNNKEVVLSKKKIKITQSINSIDDIIDIIEKNPDTKMDYNINMKLLHKIKEPLIELKNMIGMNELKRNIVDQLIYYIQKLHKPCKNGDKKNCDYMHTILYGEPGTGKTQVAKILGSIYLKLGILKNDVFKKVTRSDLVAGYLGQTAIKTKDVIESCLGGVLFIDEAYSLGNAEKRDSFSKECIDTICECLSDHKDNLMVIIAGYEDELNDCFFDLNKGLKSRFIWSFHIEPYNGIELYKIFAKRVDEYGWSLNEKEQSKIISFFEKNKNNFRYYGRDIDISFTKTKISHSRRVFYDENEKTIISFDDLEKGYESFNKNMDNSSKKMSNLIHHSMYL